MKFEYQILVYMTFFYLFAWVPASVGKYRSFGKKWLASNRDQKSENELVAWAARCERAYANLKDYFPGFVVAILLLGVKDGFDESTSAASLLYLAGRLLHFFFYGIGSVRGRFLAYLVSLAANIFLLVKVLL